MFETLSLEWCFSKITDQYKLMYELKKQKKKKKRESNKKIDLPKIL